jgi:hypothetical protein
LRDPAQAIVARLMAVQVVVDLEVIDIDENDLDRDLFAARLPPDPLDVIVEDPAVLKSRQAIALCELVQHALLDECLAQRIFPVVARHGADHGRCTENGRHVQQLAHRQANDQSGQENARRPETTPQIRRSQTGSRENGRNRD